MTVSCAGLTDVGESRDHNEDGFLVFDMGLDQDLPESGNGGGDFLKRFLTSDDHFPLSA